MDASLHAQPKPSLALPGTVRQDTLALAGSAWGCASGASVDQTQGKLFTVMGL